MLHGKILKNLFRGKNWLFCSLLSACIVCPLSSLMPCQIRVPQVERPFPFSTLRRAVFWQNRQKLVINSPPPHPISPQINAMFWLSRALSLFSGGWGGGGLFHSILYKVAIMMDDFDPSPLPKKSQEWENGAFWPPCRLQLFLLWLRDGGWGVFTCFKIVDQTRKLQPSVSNIGNICFCFLKELVTNLHIESSWVCNN